MLATYLAVIWIAPRRMTSGKAMMLGLVVSIACLTKLTTAFLGLAIPLLLLIVYRRQALRLMVPFVAVVAALTGWLLLRNLHYYGDLTGAAAMKTYFTAGAGDPINPRRLQDWIDYARNIVTYLWIPTEYYANLIRPGIVLRMIVLSLTGASALGWILSPWTRRPGHSSERSAPGALVLAVCLAVCMAMYVYNGLAHWVVPARFVLPSLSTFALLICGGHVLLFRKASRIDQRAGVVLLCLSLLVINAMILARVRHCPPDPKIGFTQRM
jgi:hypothetical protein